MGLKKAAGGSKGQGWVGNGEVGLETAKAEHGCRSTKVTSGYTHGNTYR